MNRFQRRRAHEPTKPSGPCVRRLVAALLVLAAFGVPATVAAQSPRVPPPAERAAEPPVETAVEPRAEAPIDPEAWGREVVRVGQDYTLNPRDAVGQVVVISSVNHNSAPMCGPNFTVLHDST